MAIQSDTVYRDILNHSYSKFHNNQTSTQLYNKQESTNLQLAKQPSSSITQPNPTNICESTTPNPSLPSQREIIQITQRFEKVKQLLIRHSQKQSYLHQHIYDFKPIALDWTQLSSDFSNKVIISEDLKHLVSMAQKQGDSQQIKQLLSTKFQQYYLQRHYGGLKCQNLNLNIQEKGQSSFHFISNHSNIQQNQGEKDDSPSQLMKNSQQPSQLLSKSLSYFNLREQRQQSSNQIGGYVSLINESKLSYTEDFCQTNLEDHCLRIQTPIIIQVEIPLIIYRIKEKIITYDESDIQAPYKDIDQIIDKYSKPYEELYNYSHQQRQNKEEQLQNNLQVFKSIGCEDIRQCSYNGQVGSIMVDSNVNQYKQSDLELTYSRLPEETLMMDSFARIGSLITNFNQEEEEEGNKQGLNIQQTLINPQNSKEYEQTCRTLTQQNHQLNQLVLYLKEKLHESQSKRQQLQTIKFNIQKSLNNQHQLNKSLNQKLNKINLSLLNDKIAHLTKQNASLYSEIQHLMSEVRYKSQQLQLARHQLEQLQIIADKTQQQLTRTEQQLTRITKILQQKEWQLQQMSNSQEQVIKIASRTQTSLKEQIQKLQEQKIEMTIKLYQYRQQLQNQGINLKYEQAKQIQTIIQQNQHIHHIQLSQMKQQYQVIIASYLQQLSELRDQIKIFSQTKQSKSQITCTTLKEHIVTHHHLVQLESLIKQYDRELLVKDEEIIKLKESDVHREGCEQAIEKTMEFIGKITRQLEKQREERMTITEKLIQLDRMVNKQQAHIIFDKDHQSIFQSFALRIQQIVKQNISLKEQLKNHRNKQCSVQQTSPNKQIDKLRKTICKLKRYTLQMQQQLISISGMRGCQSHSKLYSKLIEQRNYYIQLLTH